MPAIMGPPVIGEFIHMPILAHQKVARGDAGTIIFFSALATAMASFMHETFFMKPLR